MRIGRIVIFWFGLILLAILAGCSSMGSAQPTPTPLPPLVSYEKPLFTVMRGPIISEQTINGEVVPTRQEDLFFRSTGYVERVPVKAGDVIKAGDILAEQQVSDLFNQLEQARIDLDVAQANLAKEEAQQKFNIAKAKIDVNICENNVELARLELENAVGAQARAEAQINLDNSEQNLALANLDLQYANENIDPYQKQAVERSQLAVDRLESLISERQIIAPFDGVVMKNKLRPGTQVNAYSEVITVGDPSAMVVRVVYNNELNQSLNINSEVRLYPDAKIDKSYPVKYLPNFLPVSTGIVEGQSNSTGKDYFYFSYPEGVSQDALPLGKSIMLVVVLGKKEDALLLSPAAIRTYRGLNFVIVQDGDRRRRVEIYEIGLKSPQLWEITADLKEGDQVIGP
jgi:multidrug efflux pump subunit AcrA (membrane-fusion protein)